MDVDVERPRGPVLQVAAFQCLQGALLNKFAITTSLDIKYRKRFYVNATVPGIFPAYF